MIYFLFKLITENKHEKLTFNSINNIYIYILYIRRIKLTLVTINNILYFIYYIFLIVNFLKLPLIINFVC
jgi:hypothetical protein